MLYLLNSAVLPAGNYGHFHFQPGKFTDLCSILAGNHGPYISCIGYPQNIDLIESWTGTRIELSRASSFFHPGDSAFIMRLKTRLANPQEKGQPQSSSMEDWEFAWLTLLPEDTL